MKLSFFLKHPFRVLGILLYKTSLILNSTLKRDSTFVTGKFEYPEGLKVNVINDDVQDNREYSSGVNTVLVETLDMIIDKDEFIGNRILEIGPKFGVHSKWIDENLEPSHITFLELSQKESFLDEWINDIESNTETIFISIIDSSGLLKNKYDLIFFTGVLYHTVEHFKILNILRRLLTDDGLLVFQTSVDLTHDDPVILLNWSGFEQAGSYAHPSKAALFKMLAMTGWDDINHYVNYRPKSNSVLMTCRKSKELPIAYDGLSFGGST